MLRGFEERRRSDEKKGTRLLTYYITDKVGQNEGKANVRGAEEQVYWFGGCRHDTGGVHQQCETRYVCELDRARLVIGAFECGAEQAEADCAARDD